MSKIRATLLAVAMLLGASVTYTGSADAQSYGSGCAVRNVRGWSTTSRANDNDRRYCDVQARLTRADRNGLIYFYSPWRLGEASVHSTYGSAGPSWSNNCGRVRERDRNTNEVVWVGGWYCT